MVLLYTGIADLAQVKRFLRNVNNWQSLGLELGLLHPTLKRIEKEQRGLIEECKTEMLVAWLQQQDNVAVTGVPCCAVLKAALEKIGENQLASEINNLWVSVSLSVCHFPAYPLSIDAFRANMNIWIISSYAYFGTPTCRQATIWMYWACSFDAWVLKHRCNTWDWRQQRGSTSLLLPFH